MGHDEDEAGVGRLTIRLATVDDARAIAAVKAAGWRNTYSEWIVPRVLAPGLDERRVAQVVERELSEAPNVAVLGFDGNSLMGFAMFLLAGRREPHLESFHVLDWARGRGIGVALLARAVSELISLGFWTCTVSVVEQNVRSRALYERMGAVQTGITVRGSPPDEVREADYRWTDLGALRSALQIAVASSRLG